MALCSVLLIRALRREAFSPRCDGTDSCALWKRRISNVMQPKHEASSIIFKSCHKFISYPTKLVRLPDCFPPSSIPTVLCADRVGQMTKTYHDIDAVTRLLEEVR